MKHTEITINAETGKETIIERELTEQEIEEMKKREFEFEKQKQLTEIDNELTELNKDFIQELCGAVILNIEEKKSRFRELHNEKRKLLGLEPRKYN